MTGHLSLAGPSFTSVLDLPTRLWIPNVEEKTSPRRVSFHTAPVLLQISHSLCSGGALQAGQRVQTVPLGPQMACGHVQWDLGHIESE